MVFNFFILTFLSWPFKLDATPQHNATILRPFKSEKSFFSFNVKNKIKKEKIYRKRVTNGTTANNKKRKSEIKKRLFKSRKTKKEIKENGRDNLLSLQQKKT